jgi:hypothetical protein
VIVSDGVMIVSDNEVIVSDDSGRKVLMKW